MKSIIDTFESVKKPLGKNFHRSSGSARQRLSLLFFFLMKANKDLFTSQLKREQ